VFSTFRVFVIKKIDGKQFGANPAIEEIAMKPNVQIWRDRSGVVHVDAENREDLFWGQGYAQAADRGLQMILMRILGQGRASELLDASDETLAIDTFFRKMNWSGGMGEQLSALTPEARNFLGSYVSGVNARFREKTPWEFKLIGCKVDPWKMEDTVMMTRMLGYLTLSQSQGEIERLFVEMVQAGVDQGRLEALFPGLLEGLDIDLIRKVKLNERIVPPSLLWNIPVPRMMASNNWVVAGSKTASGSPILANDPHLEINRLPSVWQEMSLRVNERYMFGGAMPGFPGILAGRNPDLAWGVTYAFMDTIDSWIEDCRHGKYRRGKDEWKPFRKRTETILRKKKAPEELLFFENDHGVLDGDPAEPGYYLATRWSADRSGAESINQILNMWNVSTVEAGMDTMGRAEADWSFVFADTAGNIGFQMSGLLPKRKDGAMGLVPLPGWQAENDWGEFYGHRDLPRALNPDQGFFATANHDLNAHGNVCPINMPMGPYRADRIAALLEKGNNLTVDDMCAMHYDVFSTQAEAFMEILRPLLPLTDQGEILREWDLRYDEHSKGAYLFEAFYTELLREVFGKNGFGEDVFDHLIQETGTFIDFYLNFDRVLLSENSPWFAGAGRDDLYRRVAARALTAAPRPWGETRQFVMRHMLFGGKLPAFLGFDRGPVTGIGGRGTIHQGQIYNSAGRQTTFFPSFRFITAMDEADARTNLAGGPSDRRFSKWYVNDLENWIAGRYKTLSADPEQEKSPF
jgi:penicillin G amidase